MQKLYLVRHGESEWNNLKRIQGQKDTFLTFKGEKQAEKIANRLVSEEIDIIYSSDLKRANETANIIGEKLNLQVTPSEAFREIKFGSWEGLSTEELTEKNSEEHFIWLNQPHNFKMDGAETLYEVQKRAMNKIDSILKSNPNKNILVVSHGATIKTIILGYVGIDLKYYNRMTLNNTSLSIIEFRDRNNVIKLLNDTCHLEEDKYE
ncbi:histidine phosphatase family protein [Sporanaerobacter acetigenes]|uniref:Probable phosphoglycerate mutase n=1 Tax=Sporanaerobacter acetigenes DSM 13106 TaxID=1123281 RepID=A0A1M5XM20_9FIRM|nr:histidine phosphatase family protein [Sporanaerobacter acetigenes]SHI00851.1 probable phosphoglycerate mutase [Sporanaerobacter acetigenes DSM 13106]